MQLVLSSHHFLFSTNHHHHHHRRRRRRNYISFNLPNPNQPPISATSTTTTTSSTVSKSAITRIAEKLKTLGFTDDTPSPNPNPNSTIGEIFVPNSRQIPVHRVGHTLDRSWSSPVEPVPIPGSGDAIARLNELKEVVKKERREMRKVENERRVPSVAELGLSESERRRLITLGIRMKQKMKLGKAGITEGVVNGIHERWTGSEVVKIVCEDINRINMKRTHDLLERKTGGVVVWRAGSKIILYRGVNYKCPYFSLDEASVNDSSPNPSNLDNGLQVEENPSHRHILTSAEQSSMKVLDRSSVVRGVGSPTRVRFLLPGEKQLVEEADHLLEGLGPRFTDWWGCDPLPIDGDLLPAIDPLYRRPFRLLPYGVKPQLTNDEMTILKRLGRPLPCHFALGRNRNLQGLAAAIVKLWEKCEIAKIAIKRGVQNTSSELMAEELKRLTGGILLSRDKEFIVFYRGKDFLPSAVSSAIEERRKIRMQSNKQLKNDSITITGEHPVQISQGIAYANNKVLEVTRGSEEHKKSSIEAAIKKNTKKLSVALAEKEKAEKLLSELEQAELSQKADIDKEGITEEEKYMLRRVGLRMKPFLLLGRRGVFDGTVENMHLHWKYRELVKIICNGSDIDEIHRVARVLEAESGGILVAVERVRNGHAIIVYRGKNYQRPSRLRPQTLLNKKEALKRSIEAQRRQSLKLNVLEISRNIEKLKLKLAEDEELLDTREGQKLKVEPEKELDPNISESSPDIKEEDSQPRFQQKKVVNVPSLKDESHQNADQRSPSSVCLPTSPDSGSREKTTSGISHCGDNSEAICSEMNGSSDCGSVEDSSISMYPSIGNESEPVIKSVSDGNSEHGLLRIAEESINKQSEPSFNNKAVKDSVTAPAPARARPLTNKERLLLRKQALTMKKRPVLAVGRSNVVSGVAKAIRDHFRKYPLAIVNVKGRAKGTSVKEVVFQLEQETGGVLVSQEPSKIILYRGWGGGVETGFVGKGKQLDKHGRVPSGSVSPELIAAMRVECGLELESSD